MQTHDEQDALIDQIVATAEVIGTVISGNAAALIAEDLSGFPLLVCCEALKKCRAEVRGRLTLSDVVNRVNAMDGRPSRDEAWAIAVQSADERGTVVWTAEIMLAFDAAKPILATRDKVAARLAFVSAYDRLVESARAERRPAHWVPSFGWDASLRQLALEEAVRLQRLPMERALQIGYEATPITADGLAIAGLIAGPSDGPTDYRAIDAATPLLGGPSPEVAKRLQELRDDIAAHKKWREEERQLWVEAQAEELRRKKQRVADQVAARVASAS